MGINNSKYSFFDPSAINAPSDDRNNSAYPKDAMASFDDDRDSLWNSVGRFTFGAVIAGSALMATAYIPGMREFTRARASRIIRPNNIQDTLRMGSRMTRYVSQNFMKPFTYAKQDTKPLRFSEPSPTGWLSAQIEAFREFSTSFKTTYMDASTYAEHMNMPESGFLTALQGFANLFVDPMTSQAGSSFVDPMSVKGTVKRKLHQILGDILAGDHSDMHVNVNTARRYEQILDSTSYSKSNLRSFRPGGGGFREALRRAKWKDKGRVIVDEILDYAGLDRNENFRQATVRDHLKFLENKIHHLKGMRSNNNRILSQIDSLSEHRRNVQAAIDFLPQVTHVDVKNTLLNASIGRGHFMMNGKYIDMSGFTFPAMKHSIEDLFGKLNIPGMNIRPMDIFQYPLYKKTRDDYSQVIGLPTHPGQEYKNLIVDGQFGAAQMGYSGPRSTDAAVGMMTFTHKGRLYQNTGETINVLSHMKDGKMGMAPVSGSVKPVHGRLTPLFTAVQRLLLGGGLRGGADGNLVMNQSFLFSDEFKHTADANTMKRARRSGQPEPSEAKKGRFAGFQRVLAFLGIGNVGSISSREFSGPATVMAMVRRANEPWHKGARRGRQGIIHSEQLREQLDVHDLSAPFIHEGVMGGSLVTDTLDIMGRGIGGEVGQGLQNLATGFRRFMGELNPHDLSHGGTAHRLIQDFMQFSGRRDSRAQGVFRKLHEARSSGRLNHMVNQRLDELLPGTSKITDETVLQYMQRLKFHQLLGTQVNTAKKLGPEQTAQFLSSVHSLGGVIEGSSGFRGFFNRGRRRQVMDLFNITLVKHHPDESAVEELISNNLGMKQTLRRILPFARPPSESEQAMSMAPDVKRMFMIGARSMQSAFIPNKNLRRMLPFWLMERPQRIRGRMIGERLPVKNVINPFDKGFWTGIGREAKKGSQNMRDYVKTHWVGSVLGNVLFDMFLVGAVIYGIAPGGLLDTLTGGKLYDGISKGMAFTGGAFSWIKNNVPLIPYANVGGTPGTWDFVPGSINIGLSSFGDTARWFEDLMPKSMTSSLSQFFGGSAMLYGGFKAGAAAGRPLLGLAAGLAASMMTGFNFLDNPVRTAQETYDTLSGRKEIPHRANRWWMIGSTPFEGNEPLFYRPHMIAQIGQGERIQSRYGQGIRGKIRHLLYSAPIIGQFAQIVNPNWVVNGRPEEMAYMESGVPMTYFPAIGPTIALGLQIMSGGMINRTLSQSAMVRIKQLQNKEVKPENEQEFAIYMGVKPYSSGDLRYLIGLQLRTMQNWMGVFGFMSELAIAKIGNMLGIDALKTGHPFLHRPVLESSLEAENTTRKFYELNLGDPGFTAAAAFVGGRIALQSYPEELVPTTEYIRRYLIKRPSANYTINLAPNPQYKEGRYPDDYFIDFRYGSDASRYSYYSDLRGYSAYSKSKYSITELSAKMAPFSDWARSMIAQTPDTDMKAELSQQVFNDIRKRIKTENYRFSNRRAWAPYARNLPKTNPQVLRNREEHSGALLGIMPEWWLGATWERLTHGTDFTSPMAAFYLKKGWGQRTSLEEYKEKKIYGHNFVQWERPYETFLKPMFQEGLGRNPLGAAFKTGYASSIFFRNRTDKMIASVIGGGVGLTGSLGQSASEYLTGEPNIPSHSKQVIYNEMLMDTLAYTRGEASALGFAEGKKARRMGFPNLERKLFSQMKDLPAHEKNLVAALLPERISYIVNRQGRDFDTIKNKALIELQESGIADVEYATNNQLPTEVINAALIARGGFNPYTYNVFPAMANVGELVDKRYGRKGYEAEDFERRFLHGNKAYAKSMNVEKAHTVVREYNQEQQSQLFLGNLR